MARGRRSPATSSATRSACGWRRPNATARWPPNESTRRASPNLPARRGRSSKRSEEHTSELQSLMRISYAVFCFKKKRNRYELRLLLEAYSISQTSSTSTVRAHKFKSRPTCHHHTRCQSPVHILV